MRLIDPIELKRSIAFSSMVHDGKTLEQIIDEQPSAEPQIIRCKDCKWKDGSECVRFAEIRPFPNDFCSRAERRSDEEVQDNS